MKMKNRAMWMFASVTTLLLLVAGPALAKKPADAPVDFAMTFSCPACMPSNATDANDPIVTEVVGNRTLMSNVKMSYYSSLTINGVTIVGEKGSLQSVEHFNFDGFPGSGPFYVAWTWTIGETTCSGKAVGTWYEPPDPSQNAFPGITPSMVKVGSCTGGDYDGMSMIAEGKASNYMTWAATGKFFHNSDTERIAALQVQLEAVEEVVRRIGSVYGWPPKQ